MKRTLFGNLCSSVLIFAFMIITGGAAGPSDQDDNVEARTEAPALWLAQRNDSKIYLFGTNHIGDLTENWFHGVIRVAFDASDIILLESAHKGEDDVKTVPFGVLLDAESKKRVGEEQRLDKHLTADQWAKLDEIVRDGEFDASRCRQMAPMYAQIKVETALAQKNGHTFGNGADAIIRNQAKTDGKRCESAESFTEVLFRPYALPFEEQLAELQHTLDDVPGSEKEDDDKWQAWRHGDVDWLEDALAALRARSPHFVQSLIVERNMGFAKAAEKFSEEAQTIFFAAGVSHFVGPRSVQTFLMAAGYSVERVQN